MGFKEFIDKLAGGQKIKAPSAEDYLELTLEEGFEAPEAPKRFVKVCKLKGFADVDDSARELSEGNIVILDIKPLAERSMNELKHAVEEMKDVCISMGGDIAGLSEYHLIMTPPAIKIDRSPETRTEDFESTLERVRKKAMR